MLGGNIEERMHMETVDCGEINNYPCAYAQQGYVFGRVGLYVYLFIYIYMSTKKKNRLHSKISHRVYSTTFSLSKNVSSVVC